MFNFLFYKPVEKNLSDYIKLSNNTAINKFKEKTSVKPIYKINYDLTSLSDYENTAKKTNFNDENKIVIKKENVKNIDNNLTCVYFIKTIIVFSITFVIYIKILKRN
jgi:hypothetical protein